MKTTEPSDHWSFGLINRLYLSAYIPAIHTGIYVSYITLHTDETYLNVNWLISAYIPVVSALYITTAY
jgi:hypothetical protein